MRQNVYSIEVTQLRANGYNCEYSVIASDPLSDQTRSTKW